MGFEDDEQKHFCNAFYLAKPRTTFMCLWFYAYREYAPTKEDGWAKYSGRAPAKIARIYSNEIHIESSRFFRPNYKEMYGIYRGYYDWSNNYIVHLWTSSQNSFDLGIKRESVVPNSPMDIPTVDKVHNSIQEIFRHICFNETIITAKYRKPNNYLHSRSQCIDVPGRSP